MSAPSHPPSSPPSPPRPRATRARAGKAQPAASTGGSAAGVDTRFLSSLVGYNARRAALAVMGVFKERMAPYQLQPAEFSVLHLVGRNPGITSRQVCSALSIQPPNLVRLLVKLDERQLIERQTHPQDARALGLSLSAEGQKLLAEVEPAIAQLEVDATAALTPEERSTLIALLQKIYC